VFLNAVIIVLREVMEASLIISLFLAYSQKFNHGRPWLLKTLLLGLIGATIYAINLDLISQSFDGMGQELMNSAIQIIIYLVLLIFLISAMRRSETPLNKSILTATMMIGVIFAAVREGSEIIIYIDGFVAEHELLNSVLLGSTIGAGIGLSIGICIYYILVTMPIKISSRVGYMLLVLLAGSMISQTIQQLIQADWIMSQYPIWDTSIILSEDSTIGELLYAVIGYEATPTAIQAAAYFISLAIIMIFSIYSWRTSKSVQRGVNLK
jgi:high-affinity iron transporter